MMILMLPLIGCVTSVECPDFDLPPESVVAAMEERARAGDKEAEAWIIKLSKLYDKLAACR